MSVSWRTTPFLVFILHSICPDAMLPIRREILIHLPLLVSHPFHHSCLRVFLCHRSPCSLSLVSHQTRRSRTYDLTSLFPLSPSIVKPSPFFALNVFFPPWSPQSSITLVHCYSCSNPDVSALCRTLFHLHFFLFSFFETTFKPVMFLSFLYTLSRAFFFFSSSVLSVFLCVCMIDDQLLLSLAISTPHLIYDLHGSSSACFNLYLISGYQTLFFSLLLFPNLLVKNETCCINSRLLHVS